MESFIKFINFINAKVSAGLSYIGDHTPSFIKSFFAWIKEKLKALKNKHEEKYQKFLDWLHGPGKKRKKRPPKTNKILPFVFSPFVIALLIFAGTIYFFHKQSAMLGQQRPIDDVVKEMDQLKSLRQPAFAKFKAREFFVNNIYFPIYIKSSNSIKRLILDLNLRVSNRYIKTFFTDWNSQNLDLIYDRLNLTVEQVVPDFPLTDEGKYIIKRKVKIELDILFRELGIKGEVEKVFIAQIIGA